MTERPRSPPASGPDLASATGGRNGRHRPFERIGTDAFDGDRLRLPGTVVVAFLADWCPFCREFEPDFAGLASPSVRLLVADVTSPESPLWDRFGVDVVPTVVLFHGGRVIDRADGVRGRGLQPSDLHRIMRAIGAATKTGPR